MKTFLVGGAVRDKLMGAIPRDQDFLVVDSSPSELKQLGYRPVGLSFQVFLHPQTQAQYTLASDLVADLHRRDLTINSMALSLEGELFDPFGGQKDLQNKILRHVSEEFSQDPLRVFRVARFAARFKDFTIAPETLELMRRVVSSEEFKGLPTDRIFPEFREALRTSKPSIFFEVLRSVDGLKAFFPELAQLQEVPQRAEYHPEGDAYVHTMLVLDAAAEKTNDLQARFSALVHDLGKGVTPKKLLPRHHGHEESGIPLVKKFCQRLKVPNEWLEAAVVVTRFHLKVHRLFEMKASTIVRLFYEMDAFRKPHLVTVLALACEADEMGKLRKNISEGSKLREYFDIVARVNRSQVPEGLEGVAIAEAIRALRVRTLEKIIY